MKIFTKADLIRKCVKLKIKEGAVFIYPTDTIYGIGCDAENDKAVKRIRKIKSRESKPFSVIAPSKRWIKENCNINRKIKGWLKKLPGAYTLILELKNKDAVANSVNMNLSTLGARMPNHWFYDIVRELKIPIVTTSVNKAGKEFMTSLDNLDFDIRKKIDFIIYEGEKIGKPSKIINCVENKIIGR